MRDGPFSGFSFGDVAERLAQVDTRWFTRPIACR
jgi:hypothetical protein